MEPQPKNAPALLRRLERDCFGETLAFVSEAVTKGDVTLSIADAEGVWYHFGSAEGGENPDLDEEWIKGRVARTGAVLSEEGRLFSFRVSDHESEVPAVLTFHDCLPGELDRSRQEVLSGVAGLVSKSIQDQFSRLILEDRLASHQEDLRHFKNFYENAAEGFYQTTIEGSYLKANLTLARLYGYETVEELLRDNEFTAKQLYVEEGRRETFIRQMNRQDSITGFESEVFRKDGSRFWISESARVIRDRNGHILFFEGTVSDITRRKAAEISLLASRAELESRVKERTLELSQHTRRFDSLMSNVPGMLYQYEVNREGEDRLTFASEGSFAIYGLEPEEVVENVNLVHSMIHPDDSEVYRNSIARAIREQSDWHWSGRLKLPSGEEKWIQGQSKISRDSHGTVIHSLDGSVVWDGIIIDVTDLRSTKAELNRTRKHHSTILEITPDGIFTVDGSGRVLGVNPAGETMLGTSEKRLIGEKLEHIFHAPESSAQIPDIFTHLEGSPFLGRRTEMIGRRTDGSEFPAELTFSAVTNEGETTYPIYVRDITGRKKNESRLRKSRDEAQRASLAKSDFLSRMSHELRTPLNAILGFSHLLSRSELEADNSEQVAFIQRAGKHLLDLINEVLDLSRVEAGRLCISKETVAIDELIREVRAYTAPLAMEKSVEVKLEDSFLKGALVIADQQRLKQILLNLVANGIKYNQHAGKVSLGCRRLSDSEVELTVCDTGPGIPEENLEDLFTPFERLGADERSIEGTGIGLALSQSLAELMGTVIEVETEVGAGTTFSLKLKRVTSDVPAEAPPSADRAGKQKSSPILGSTSRDGIPGKILYIEDNPLNLRLMKELLRGATNWQLLTAETGKEGIQSAIQIQPDLILLDVHLPDINGDEVLKQLRAIPEIAGTEIAMLTADAMSESETCFRDLGADHFLTKPIDIPRMKELLEEVYAGIEGLVS